MVKQGSWLRLFREESINQPKISRVVLLKRGSVMADGPKDELLRDQSLSKLFNTPLKVVTGGDTDRCFRLQNQSEWKASGDIDGRFCTGSEGDCPI